MAIHRRNIIHTDIKPDNILLDSLMRVKVCDFGTAVKYGSENTAGLLYGTRFYMAPEIENMEEYDFKIDIWSLGCCLFFMLTGEYPF